MAVKLEAGWNEFLIEKGVRDPLAVWRVGGRMVSELLRPYTTVITNRPARYFSMYSWAIHRLNEEHSLSDKTGFWRRFARLEAILLCAIASHPEHAYPGFGGAIGTKASSELLRKVTDGAVDLSRFTKIANGWQTNYLKPMRDLGLLDLDPGLPSGLKLTSAGLELAEAYGASIRTSEFFRSYVTSDRVPIRVIEELASVGCTCLLHSPSTELLRTEHHSCLKHLLVHPNSERVNCDEPDLLEASMHLLLDVLRASDDIGEPLNLTRWRRVLSTGLLNPNSPYNVPGSMKSIFRKWQLYNADALLVYSLEQGLAGFLEDLHKRGTTGLSKTALKAGQFTKAHDRTIETEPKFTIFRSGQVRDCVQKVARLDPGQLYRLEAALIDEVHDSDGRSRVASAYLLHLYVRGIFEALETTPNNHEAIEFYADAAQRDGHELSLLHLASRSSDEQGVDENLVDNFLVDLVINRQLSTREARGKEQAWFAFISETATYEWESEYVPHLYRAARSNIFMSLVLSLGLVERSEDEHGWLPNRQALSNAGL